MKTSGGSTTLRWLGQTISPPGGMFSKPWASTRVSSLNNALNRPRMRSTPRGDAHPCTMTSVSAIVCVPFYGAILLGFGLEANTLDRLGASADGGQFLEIGRAH